MASEVTYYFCTCIYISLGSEVCYPILDGRFKDGLGKIAKSVEERLSASRIVTVAGQSRELNATNAESIIATIIKEANKGKIDLV